MSWVGKGGDLMSWEDMAFSDFNRMMLRGGLYPASKGTIKVYVLKSKVERSLRAWIKLTGDADVRKECGIKHHELRAIEVHLFPEMKYKHFKEAMRLIENEGEVEAMKYLKTLLKRRYL